MRLVGVSAGLVALENSETPEPTRVIMLISLAALLVALRSTIRLRLDLQLENLALRQQIVE
jgi:hypothetical protein